MSDIDPAAPIALATVFACVLAALVAWRLYRAEVVGQRVGLAKERLAHFRLLRTYLSLRAGDRDEVWQAHDELQNAQDRYYCLFGRQIGNLVAETLDKGSERDAQQQALQHACVECRENLRMKVARLDAWFANEGFDLRKRFDPYLNFPEKKPTMD